MEDSILPLQVEETQEQQDSHADPTGFINLLLQPFSEELQQAMTRELLPRARDISNSMQHIQKEAEQAANDSNAELQAAEAELARLSGLVLSFQQAWCQVLQPAPHA